MGRHSLAGQVAAKVVRELLGAGVAIPGRLGHGAGGDRAQRRRHPAFRDTRRRTRLRLLTVGRPGRQTPALAPARAAGQEVEQDRAERVDVGPPGHVAGKGLLRRHVGRGAQDRAGAGQVDRGRLLRALIGPRLLLVGGIFDVLGQSPVDDDRLAVVADDDVVRLEVAVDDAAVVGVGDRVGHRQDAREQPPPLRVRVAGVDELVERAAGDQLHGVVRRAVRPAARLVDRDHVRVLEARGDDRLADEARLRARRPREQLLQRDVAAEVAIGRAQDAADTTATVLADDLVAVRIAHAERELARVDGGQSRLVPLLAWTRCGGGKRRRRQRRRLGVGIHRHIDYGTFVVDASRSTPWSTPLVQLVQRRRAQARLRPPSRSWHSGCPAVPECCRVTPPREPTRRPPPILRRAPPARPARPSMTAHSWCRSSCLWSAAWPVG